MRLAIASKPDGISSKEQTKPYKMKTRFEPMIPLSEKELLEIDGGNPALFIASAAFGIACIYYAGYAIGKWMCDCD
jgi:hypothetical protein